jgi:hypothetical protein
VTHPSPGSNEKSPSIAGVVASSDPLFTQYPASIRTQEGKKEMVIDLEEMIIERLRLWQARNKGLPDKVIVYRDGVSEGQYAIVLNTEYAAFVAAFGKLYGASSKHPKVTIVVVGKRHHTRFYPTTTQDADGRTGNCQPGTVVDRGVTGERIFDWFLVAHQGLQGTSKPAHYVVIKDDNKLGADQLQKLVSLSKRVSFVPRFLPILHLFFTYPIPFLLLCHLSCPFPAHLSPFPIPFRFALPTYVSPHPPLLVILLVLTYTQTHNLCYTFGRATRSVSICPPAYYADILCERGRSYLHNVLKGDGAQAFGATHWHRDVHAALKDTMFYL